MFLDPICCVCIIVNLYPLIVFVTPKIIIFFYLFSLVQKSMTIRQKFILFIHLNLSSLCDPLLSARVDLNHRHRPYKDRTLTPELLAVSQVCDRFILFSLLLLFHPNPLNHERFCSDFRGNCFAIEYRHNHKYPQYRVRFFFLVQSRILLHIL